MSANSGSGGGADFLKNLNWPTVALIAVTGGTNFLANQNNTSQVRADQLTAYHQIQDLHASLDDFEKRQKALLTSMDLALTNQSAMLRNQSSILEELHKKEPQQ